jgi:GNAT superfamily N-acetyltransferase
MNATLAPSRVVVRDATVDDVPRIVEMALRFIRSSVYAGLLAENPEQIARCAHLMIGGEQFALFVAEKAGEVVGMAGFIVHEHLFSAEPIADELFWWVDPEARGRAGLLLLRRAEEWAQERGAKAVQMIAPTVDVERFYERVGYVPIERSFQKRF